jgi:cell wall-associated NlpC family hydrolase
MNWYFEDPTRAAALIAAARSWRGTPFAMFSRAKGPHGGVDCVAFVEEVTAAAGLERFDLGRTDEDYSRHVHNDKILNHFRGLADNPNSVVIARRWDELPEKLRSAPMVGDILICKDGGRIGDRGNGVFHMPIMVSPTIFMHCAPKLGVAEGQIDDPTYSDHIVAHFRARGLQ